jgi:hypothetical protein
VESSANKKFYRFSGVFYSSKKDAKSYSLSAILNKFENRANCRESMEEHYLTRYLSATGVSFSFNCEEDTRLELEVGFTVKTTKQDGQKLAPGAPQTKH